MDFSPVTEIKNRLDIVELIGSYIKLQKAGRNFKALCPFHSEKTASFMVSPERQTWHCFGCGLGGDIFSFVEKIEGVEFGDALRVLANRAGVVLKKQDPALNTKRKRLYEICELAAQFFQKQLEATKAGQAAGEYLKKERGLKPETIKIWRLGWAPDGWNNLVDFLAKRGYRSQEILDAGLVIIRDKFENQNPEVATDAKFKALNSNSVCYDRFRSRIMFPIFDIQGQVVGFAGRIFGKEDPNVGKYINTPQTQLYDKSRLLYGLNFGKLDIRQQNSCILVEGNLDVIMSHQAGVKNAVASSGTALTAEHLKIIKRYSDNLIFAFDADLAGNTATKRSIDLALENDFDIKVARIDQKDPADLIKQNPADWEKAIKAAVSVMDFYFASAFENKKNIGVSDKKNIAKILLPVIKKIANQIEQAHWIGELAKKLKIDEKILYEEMRKIKNSLPSAQSKTLETGKKEKTRVDELEERMLSLCLNYPEYFKKLPDLSESICFDQNRAKILEEFKAILSESSSKDKHLETLKNKLPAELACQVDLLCFKAEQYPIDESLAQEEIAACIKELKILRIKKEMDQLTFEIQEAHNRKDKASFSKIMEKFKNLSNQLNEIKK